MVHVQCSTSANLVRHSGARLSADEWRKVARLDQQATNKGPNAGGAESNCGRLLWIPLLLFVKVGWHMRTCIRNVQHHFAIWGLRSFHPFATRG
jgi:hypothetical protein